MDIVYASLRRRPDVAVAAEGEKAEVLGALWAHATPADGLEHVCCRPEADRVDLILYLLTRRAPDRGMATQRVGDLLARCHTSSPTFHRRYQPPAQAN